MKTSINIKGMHCGSCSMLIKEALSELDGVKSADVSHENGKAKIEFDETIVTLEAIRSAIEKEGYKVRR